MERIWESGLDARIHGNQLLHLLCVSRKNDDHVDIVFRKGGQQGIHRNFSEVLFAVSVIELVCFVYEEDVAFGSVQDASHLELGLADMASD